MRCSRMLLATMRQNPTESEIASHRLMQRAGMVRLLASGIYTWLPLGVRVLRKVEAIVREEMNAAGAQEVMMPAVQPAELWQESGRWNDFGPELLRLQDRHERDFCIGPTHEEVITDIVRREVRSYRQLPLNLYQIQTKFRDEIRPRFGVMRAREFIMKDAYSFDLDARGLERSYLAMHDAYHRIFNRVGVDFRVVDADSGAIGGSRSQEFHVLADYGEDAIAFSSAPDDAPGTEGADTAYAANLELVPCPAPAGERPAPSEAMRSVRTPQVHTIDDLASSLDIACERCLKTLLVEGEDGGIVGLVLRGDHELNIVKAMRLSQVKSPLAFVEPDRIEKESGCPIGSVGPVAAAFPVIVDAAAAAVGDFVCGANREGEHLAGVNWGRDLPEPVVADLRNAIDGDPAPDGSGPIAIRRGIEVGHIFQLGDKYSTAMEAVVLDEAGEAIRLMMGCYGIGVTRIAAATIEQNHDDDGIIWPEAIAPFHVTLLPMNMHKSRRLQEAAEGLWGQLEAAGFETLFDDRKVRPGVMFADADLIGIPHRLIVSDRGLDAGKIEYRHRSKRESLEIPLADAVEYLRSQRSA